jgi:prefoldin subunit 5
MAAAAEAAEGTITIPKAEFLDDVPAFMEGKDADKVISQLQENVRTYRMLQDDLAQKRGRTMQKLPELRRAIEIVEQLIEKKAAGEPTVTDFVISEGVYAKARIPKAETVNLWLGADVMLEYPLEEALTLLKVRAAAGRHRYKPSDMCCLAARLLQCCCSAQGAAAAAVLCSRARCPAKRCCQGPHITARDGTPLLRFAGERGQLSG